MRAYIKVSGSLFLAVSDDDLGAVYRVLRRVEFPAISTGSLSVVPSPMENIYHGLFWSLSGVHGGVGGPLERLRSEAGKGLRVQAAGQKRPQCL
jgi:hypothetical protein